MGAVLVYQLQCTVLIQSTECIVLLLVLLIPTVLWYMYESVLQYQYWLTDFAVCRYIASGYSICACASLHAHCK